jgi:hypothetical protein
MMQRLLGLALWLLKQAVYFAMWLRRSLRFSSPRKKRRFGTPPWWLRLSIYLAMWPKPEFYEYRVSLQRKYLKSKLKESPAAATRFAMRSAAYYYFEAVLRIARAIGILVQAVGSGVNKG